MSVNRQYRNKTFECDECGLAFPTTTTDFFEALDQLKEAEWLIVKHENKWRHICPECQDEAPKDVA